MANEPGSRRIVSRRVTPAGGASHPAPAKGGHKARAKGAKDQPASSRYTPPVVRKQDLPSPTWVPVLMFALLIAGALVIILNYVGVLGSVSNVKLVVGLALILGGIVTATQYR
ncbi:MAG: hypothetical protein JWM47_2039 [Acidimicrobiales bacterium]|nr:hypothetical protein [Acidimicrobiales bacterium]